MGVHNEWVANAGDQPIFVHYSGDPYDYVPAPAIEGGKVPPQNVKELVLPDGRRVGNQEVRDTKAFALTSGARVVDFVQGGCGVGKAWKREPEKVLEDARNELISLESAESDYGVVIDSESLQIDVPKTEALRTKMKLSDEAKS